MIGQREVPTSTLPRSLIWWMTLLVLVAPWWVGFAVIATWVFALFGHN